MRHKRSQKAGVAYTLLDEVMAVEVRSSRAPQISFR